MDAFEFLQQVEPADPGRGLSPVYRNAACDPNLPLASNFEGSVACWETWVAAVDKNPDQQCLGERLTLGNGKAAPYSFQTFREVHEEVQQLARAMVAAGLLAGGRVGIYGVNSPAWVKAMIATSAFSGVCVPLYDSLGPQAASYVIAHSGMQIVFVQGDKFTSLVNAIKDCMAGKSTSRSTSQASGLVRDVVVWGHLLQGSEDDKAWLTNTAGIRVHSFDGFMSSYYDTKGTSGSLGGKDVVECKLDACMKRPQPSDIATIMYTSGTTGEPKGVMLTHKALVSTVASQITYMRDPLGRARLVAMEQRKQSGIAVSQEQWAAAAAEARRWPQFERGDTHLSYLPLAHIYERAIMEAALALGAGIGFWQGDVTKLQHDAAALRPAMMVGVPRVWERVAAGVRQKLQAKSPIARWIFNWMYKKKLAKLMAGSPVRSAFWLADFLVFRKVAAAFGGRLKMIISGAAPLSKEIEEYVRTVLCCYAGQGYGLTETCSATCVAPPDRWDCFGTIGPVQTCAEMRLAAVQDMEYNPLEPGKPMRGELLLRGPCCFTGYHNNEEATKQAIDTDGWFHTGDIVEVQPGTGSLKIIDRLSNTVKLSQGEFVPLDAVATQLLPATLLEELWVDAQPGARRLVAVAVPNKEVFITCWDSQGHHDEAAAQASWSAICASKEAQQMVLDALRKVATSKGIPAYQIPAAVHIEPETPEPWTIENGLRTPTSKLKRAAMRKHYRAAIEAMYQQMS